MSNANPISWSHLFSIVSSLVSITLGGFAIFLSLYLYKQSSEFSTKIKESADRIGGAVERLEALFDKLYTDTFSIMKETVSDMRKHAWREEPSQGDQIAQEAERRADQKVKQLEEQINREVSEVLNRQATTETRVAQLAGQIEPVVRRAIAESRQAEVEAREETIRDHIRRAYDDVVEAGLRPTTSAVISKVGDAFAPRQIAEELFKMAREGLASWPGSPEKLPLTAVLKFK